MPPWYESREPMLMIDPDAPRASRYAPNSRHRVNTADRFTCRTFPQSEIQIIIFFIIYIRELTSSQSWSGNASLGCRRWMPAQFSRILTAVPSLVTLETISFTAARSDNSAAWMVTLDLPSVLCSISSRVCVLLASLYRPSTTVTPTG